MGHAPKISSYDIKQCLYINLMLCWNSRCTWVEHTGYTMPSLGYGVTRTAHNYVLSV